MSFNKRFVNSACDDLLDGKIHTIRANYHYWKRFTGKEVALFYWEGVPYKSKQKIFCIKTIKAVVPSCFDGKYFWHGSLEGSGNIQTPLLARNDGFKDVNEFHKWFENYKHPAIMCIIHFTDFRYSVSDTDNPLKESNKKMKLYISGKITGDNDYRRKFIFAGIDLCAAGYNAVNPVLYVKPGTDWNAAMRTALKIMLDCDGVALLSDWLESKGAKIEAGFARELGIPVKPIEEWRKETSNE
jgi:hypothetical protein